MSDVELALVIVASAALTYSIGLGVALGILNPSEYTGWDYESRTMGAVLWPVSLVVYLVHKVGKAPVKFGMWLYNRTFNHGTPLLLVG